MALSTTSLDPSRVRFAAMPAILKARLDKLRPKPAHPSQEMVAVEPPVDPLESLGAESAWPMPADVIPESLFNAPQTAQPQVVQQDTDDSAFPPLELIEPPPDDGVDGYR